MGWNAIDKDGRLYFEGGKYSWNELDIDSIELVWLDALPFMRIHRNIKNFKHFIHYYELRSDGGIMHTEAEFIGWTDGKKEYVIGISNKKHPHPRHKSLRS